MINAFKHTKQLEEVGFTRQQAEIQLQVFNDMIQDGLATKQDLKALESAMSLDMTALKHDMKSLESALKQEMRGLENKMQQIEYRLTIKLGTLMVIGFTTMATLLKFWLVHS